jgi:hypothetical protein
MIISKTYPTLSSVIHRVMRFLLLLSYGLLITSCYFAIELIVELSIELASNINIFVSLKLPTLCLYFCGISLSLMLSSIFDKANKNFTCEVLDCE